MKELLAAHTVEAVGIIIAAITAIGVFVGPWLASRRQRKIAEQDRKLKIHFEELKREAQEIIRIISRVSEDYGEIVSHSEATYSEITSVVLPQPSDNFMAHFPEEMTKLGEYSRRIEAYNRDYEAFRAKIIDALNSEETLVLDWKIAITAPCISESVVDPLISYWTEFTPNGRTWPDFRFMEESPYADGQIDLCPKGWAASAAARVRTESDKVKYCRALREVAANEEFKREATTLRSAARQLLNEIRTFPTRLLDKLDNVDRLWPGTKKYTFRKEKKNCPRCKEIFH